jgi:hypothetical protein
MRPRSREVKCDFHAGDVAGQQLAGVYRQTESSKPSRIQCYSRPKQGPQPGFSV